MSETYMFVGHEIETPLVNAAGSINGSSAELIIREISNLAGTAIGALTYGSVTVTKQAGNEAIYGAPVYHHDPVTGKTHNSIGLENIGYEAAEQLTPKLAGIAHDSGKTLIVSVSPTKSSPENGGDAFEQVDRLVTGFLGTDADLIEINTSCPNVVTEGGGRKPILGYDLEAMEEMLDVLADKAGGSGRIGLKLPPYMSDEEKLIAPQLAQLFRRYPDTFNFLVVSNTIPNQVARDEEGEPILTVPGGIGGMSGPATKEVGREQLKIWHDLIDVEIVSTLGLHNGKELAIRRRLGATAGGFVTRLWESGNWGMAVTDFINEWVEAEEKLSSWSQHFNS